MKKKQIIVIISVLIGFTWILTLGVHYFNTCFIICKEYEPSNSPPIIVSVDDNRKTFGIPFVFSLILSDLPFPLDVKITIDDSIHSQFAVIESILIEYDDGEKNRIVKPEHYLKEELVAYTPDKSARILNKTFKQATISIADVIRKKEDAVMIISGGIYDDRDRRIIPFNRTFRIACIRLRSKLVTGWQLLKSQED